MNLNAIPTKALLTFTALSFACLVGNAQQSDMGKRTTQSEQTKSGESATLSAPPQSPQHAASSRKTPKSTPVPLTGRLPRYFASVVSPEQRLDIYRIQQAYRIKIEALQQELEALRESEMQEVEAVLSPTQLEQIESRRDQASRKATEDQPGAKTDASAKTEAETGVASSASRKRTK